MAKKITTSKTTTTKSIKKVEDKQKPAPAAIKEQPKSKPVSVKPTLEKKKVAKEVATIEIKKVESVKVATKSPAPKKNANQKANKEVQPSLENNIAKEEVDSSPAKEEVDSSPVLDTLIEESIIETADLSVNSNEEVAEILDIQPQIEAPKEKSEEQLAYEEEIRQFNKHIEDICKFWHSHCSGKSHYEKHDIVSICAKQGIEVKFSPVNDETTKVTFTKRRTAFSFQSKTIFW